MSSQTNLAFWVFSPLHLVCKHRLRYVKQCIDGRVEFTEVHIETDQPNYFKWRIQNYGKKISLKVGDLISCPSYLIGLGSCTSYLPSIIKFPDIKRKGFMIALMFLFVPLPFCEPMNFFSVQSNGKIDCWLRQISRNDFSLFQTSVLSYTHNTLKILFHINQWHLVN